MENPERGRWLLLVHQLPPRPPYLRAKILRRLKQVGAFPLKNSAYLLPATEEAAEDFQWLLQEIKSADGECWIFRAEAVAGLTPASIEENFRQLRAADYRDLAADAHALAEQLAAADPENRASAESTWRKLKKRQDEIGRIDFFEAPGKDSVEIVMKEISQALEGGGKSPGPQLPIGELKGRTWVTRRGIKIDRTASAWLIRRFIDPLATFSFVEPKEYVHREGELRFDMFEGEFTHQGDSCTFEVLLDRCGLVDPGLRIIAEIVHDLDLKDGKFERPETAGIASMIAGIAIRNAADEKRLAEGLVIFDSLYDASKAL